MNKKTHTPQVFPGSRHPTATSHLQILPDDVKPPGDSVAAVNHWTRFLVAKNKNMGVNPKNSGKTPKIWMFFLMEFPGKAQILMDDVGGSIISGNTHIMVMIRR